jgi:hypothetical protein
MLWLFFGNFFLSFLSCASLRFCVGLPRWMWFYIEDSAIYFEKKVALSLTLFIWWVFFYYYWRTPVQSLQSSLPIIGRKNHNLKMQKLIAWTLLISFVFVFRHINSKDVTVKSLIAYNWSQSKHYLYYLCFWVHCVIVDVNGRRCEAAR